MAYVRATDLSCLLPASGSCRCAGGCARPDLSQFWSIARSGRRSRFEHGAWWARDYRRSRRSTRQTGPKNSAQSHPCAGVRPVGHRGGDV